MKSSRASSTGPGFFPEPGADSAADSGPAYPATGVPGDSGAAGTAGARAGYGPGGPLAEEAIWTAPRVFTDPADTGHDASTDTTNPSGPLDPGNPSDPIDPGGPTDPDARTGPVALTGRVSVTAMVSLTAGQTMTLLKTLSVLRSWVDAQEAKAATHLHDLIAEEHPWAEDQDRTHALAGAEIGAALRIPERSAGFLLDTSELLIRRYPATLHALEGGKLSQRHAAAVVQEAISIPDTIPTVSAAFEAQLIALAAQTTVVKFTHQAQRLRENLHPESISTRHRKALQDRRVYLAPTQDGMAWLQAFLPTEQAAGIFHRVDTAARALQGPDEARTLTQLRADVLVDVLTSAGPTGHMHPGHMHLGHAGHMHPGHTGDVGGGCMDTGAMESGDMSGVRESGGPKDSGASGDPASGVENRGGNTSDGGNGTRRSREASTYWGVQAKVFVTVPVMTLLGGNTPGELEGYGPIDPETARRLAGHAPSFTRILTHPHTGARLGADATTYRVPQDLQDAVRVRDGTCRHPGCNRLAVFCELDHTTPWAHGGKTTYANLASLCKRHHMFKTEGYWHYQQPEPGTIIAISPIGETYLTQPNPPPTPPTSDPAPF